MVVDHDEGLFCCAVARCGKRYKAAPGLKQHLVRHHADEDVDVLYAAEAKRARAWRLTHQETTRKVLGHAQGNRKQRVTNGDDMEEEGRARKKSKGCAEEDEGEEEDLEEEEEEGEGEEEQLFCYCQKPYDKKRFMIACDGCDEWFHAECLGTTDAALELIDVFFCPDCRDRDRYLCILYKDRPKTPCAMPGCEQAAGEHSKYCSHKCALVLALLRARAIIRTLPTAAAVEVSTGEPEGEEPHNTTMSPRAPDTGADHTVATAPLTAKRVASHMEGQECRVCGHMTSLRGYARHMHTCYLKVEELHVRESLGTRAPDADYCSMDHHPADTCPLHAPLLRRALKDGPCGGDADACSQPRSLCMQHCAGNVVQQARASLRTLLQRERRAEHRMAEAALDIAAGHQANPYTAVFHHTTAVT